MFKITDTKTSILKSKNILLQKLYDPSIPKYIMGRNEYAIQIINSSSKEQLHITGIIDDYTTETMYNKLPLYKTNNVDKDGIIIVCVIDGKLITAINRLQEHGFSNILTYFDLILHNKQLFPKPSFCENNVIDIENNMEKYNWLYNNLDDMLSRDTLLHITDFRYNFNIEAMRFFSFRLTEQYYDVVEFNEEEIFVDCGAYDGKTTSQFIDLNPTYKAVHVFEPSPKQYEITCNTLSSYSNVHLYPYATYDKNGTTIFNSEDGSASGLSNKGNITVKTVRLDDVIQGPITYIKLDVEGVEYETLIGAEQLIKTYKPKLAICVYHNQEDFWRIPSLLLQYNPNYRIILRHYTEGLLETVMYFL